MPAKRSSSSEVYAISSFIWDDDATLEGLQPVEIYTTPAAANAAAKAMLRRHAARCDPDEEADQYDYTHSEDENGLYYGEIDGGVHGHVAAKVKVFKTVIRTSLDAQTVIGRRKAIKMEHEEEEEEEDDDDDEQENFEEEREEKEARKSIKKGPPKTAIGNIQRHRKTIPQGIPNCLAGLKILFTGTFETMDRKTSIATAYKYGAEVITKLEDTDYIVIGTRAGPAKLKKINELELETISEEEFFQILENGIPEDKKERMANRRLADLEGPEEEDDEEEVKPRKRAAPPKTGLAKKKARR